MLVTDKPANRQVILATHSGDVLRGVLDSNAPNIRVVRIQRVEDTNAVTELGSDQIRELWNDPLLRYSNVLDGLFHECVLVTEGDADCRFYSAVMDAEWEREHGGSRRPDIMCTHAGGKARIPTITRALHGMGVPILVVTDFDILNDEYPLHAIVESVEGNWGSIAGDWKQVKTAVDSKKPELSSTEVSEQITRILADIADPVFPQSAKKKIQALFRRSSPWSAAKESGSSIIPSGQPTQAYQRLLAHLHSIGIYIVEVGEIECFAKSIGGHGPSWVNEALQRDLAVDSEFHKAREFASLLLVRSAVAVPNSGL